MKKYLPLCLILVLGLLLRLPLISGSFWLDEAAQALESARPLSQQHLIADDFQPPLFHYLVHFLLYLTRSEAGLRSVSVISGLVSIALIYLMIKKEVGEQAAVIAGLLLAINPFHIFFSQELRPYSLATLFACLSWWALISPGRKGNRLMFILATTGGLYSMYLYPFVLLSQLLYISREKRERFRSVLVASFISGLLFLPWLPFLLQQLRSGSQLASALPGWSEVVATPTFKALPLVLAKFMLGPVALRDSVLYYLMGGLSILIVLAAVVSVWKEKKHRFLVYWFVVTIIGAWLISFIVPVIAPKRVMVALPAMMGILAAWTAGHHWSRYRIALYFVGAVFFLSVVLYWNVPGYQRENWRDLTQLIEADANGKKAVAVFAFPQAFAPWRWYQTGVMDTVATGRFKVEDTVSLNEPLKSVPEYPRVYLFDYLRDLSDPGKLINAWLSLQGYREVRSLDGGNVGFVRVYDSL